MPPDLHGFLSLLFPILFGILTCGCGAGPASIEFTKVPASRPGDPIQVDAIEGRVTGARPGQKIVLYAKSELWWVQPEAEHPFTEIQADSSWKNVTHPGTHYAALLVESGFVPPLKILELPRSGGAVRAVAIQEGRGALKPRPPQTVRFSGYDWEIREQPSNRGGGLNPYEASNVGTDSNGFLHLRTARKGGQWSCAEVQLTQSLGHGLYRFTVRDVSQLDPVVVLTMYTRDEAAPDQHNREIDIEVSQWGNTAGKNGQFVVPPFSEPTNVVRFVAPAGPLSYSFRWESASVSFQATRGSSVIAQHEFTSSVPTPGSETARMNLYVYGTSRIPARSASEVVIEKFEYLP